MSLLLFSNRSSLEKTLLFTLLFIAIVIIFYILTLMDFHVNMEIFNLRFITSNQKAIDGKIPVLFDSGISRGNDALKAIALGSDAVLIGRTFVYSLASGGEKGVRNF